MRVEIAAPEPRSVFIDPADSALVVVDMQNNWLKKEGSVVADRGKSAIAATSVLLGKFRAAGSKVIFIKSVRKPDALEYSVFGRDLEALEGTWDSDIVDDLSPGSAETVVVKDSYDAFNGTPLETVLQDLDLRPCRSQIVVAGVATNVAFDCAVTGFRVRGFLVYVPTDATAAASEKDELIAFRHFIAPHYYNSVATRSDLVTLDGDQVGQDPLAGSITHSDLVFTDPLYRAITGLTLAD
ncbi:MAG TPA: isochorismatase family cysteine hydrolase [Jatrophihabitantaceae bacterium]|jgi:nicotinamidase-related amidase|nr:isochorismatase family cysteine hydrolase [Jatrophihabitantaceae bacterium]